jgi:hypothetical protein
MVVHVREEVIRATTDPHLLLGSLAAVAGLCLVIVAVGDDQAIPEATLWGHAAEVASLATPVGTVSPAATSWEANAFTLSTPGAGVALRAQNEQPGEPGPPPWPHESFSRDGWDWFQANNWHR